MTDLIRTEVYNRNWKVFDYNPMIYEGGGKGGFVCLLSSKQKSKLLWFVPKTGFINWVMELVQLEMSTAVILK